MSTFKPLYKDFYKYLNENTITKHDFSRISEYLLKNSIRTFSGKLYHGTPKEGLLSMLTDGIDGQQHGEISDYNTLSTSVNEHAIEMFSEGDGYTGFEFKINKVNVIVLSNMIAHLTSRMVGSGIDFDIDEDELEEFCLKFNIPKDRFGEYSLPWNFITNLGIDAWCYDYVWKNLKGLRGRDEAEICFVGEHGMKILNNSIDTIYIDGETFEIGEKEQAIEILS